MNYKIWRNWIKTIPWPFKWFVLLVLIRPIADNFYYLKEFSSLLSPLYWIGLLTPILTFWGIVRGKPSKSIQDAPFEFWAFFVIFNIFMLLLSDNELISYILNAIKLSLPLFLYFFLRKFIKTQKDFESLLLTFLYSCFVAYGLLLYESIIKPFNTETTRGLVRLQGGYGDAMNYAIYLIYGLLITLYFFIKQGIYKINIRFVLIISAIVIIGLIKIKHVTTFVAVFSLLILFFWYLFKKQKGYVFILLIIGSITFFFIKDILVGETLDPLLKREYEVIEGSRDKAQMFHGRMSRWTNTWGTFLKSHTLNQYIGYPTTGNFSYSLIGINPHNDFFRIIFFTGYIGFIFYILFLLINYRNIQKYYKTGQFIGLGNLLVLTIYSMTTLPTLYAPMLYPIMIIFAYYARSEKYYLNAGKKKGIFQQTLYKTSTCCMVL